MAFCLAGALSFNLASPESADNTPVFAQLMLDEAFSKSDPQFAQQALSAFRKFGFQLVIVATVQNATTIQPYIDSVVMVSKTEATGRNARPVATVATRTISEFTSLRQEMRKADGGCLQGCELSTTNGVTRSSQSHFKCAGGACRKPPDVPHNGPPRRMSNRRGLIMTRPFEVHESGAYLHGTKADLSVGDLLVPGRASNFEEGRISNHSYFTRTLDAQCGGPRWPRVKAEVGSTSSSRRAWSRTTRT